MLALCSLFSDHAALQRDFPIPVWGTGHPGASVVVTLADQTQTCRVDEDGKWKVVFDPLQPPGPYELTAESGAEKVSVQDLLVGDVWLCSGQSNMQWPLKDSLDPVPQYEIADRSPNTRLFLVPKEGLDTPREKLESSWNVGSATSIAEFSAVAWYFSRELRESESLKDIPIGLIDCSYGGTRAEAWIRKETLAEKFEPSQLQDSFLGWKPSSMYNGMLSPLVPYSIRGALWYQGESNTDDPDTYGDLMKTLIEEWRTLWNRPDLPFYFVQLPNYAEPMNSHFFTRIREVQLELSKKVPHTAMAVTLDCGEPFDLHPPNKEPIGRRLGKIARARTYDEDIVYAGPIFKSMEREGTRLRLSFDHIGSGLAIGEGYDRLEGFSLCGPDGTYWNAESEIDGDSVVVGSDHVSEPAHVRYAWAGNPRAALYNQEGLPASPFRTDDFEATDAELYERPSSFVFTSPIYEAEIGWDGCLTRISVSGKDFLDTSFEGSRGLFLLDIFDIPHRLLDRKWVGPNALAVSNLKTTVRYAFGPSGFHVFLRNKIDEDRKLIAVLQPEVEVSGAVSNSSKTVLSRGDVTLTLIGGKGITGPWSQAERIWEATLEPKEEKTIEIQITQNK